ncbi:hypothetical protein F5X99DRAFT_429961 [Biscogniauxia marginata]|nr:hypothetical protein F5X99DRAFT_429961 [Biscogniauxia marginata]
MEDQKDTSTYRDLGRSQADNSSTRSIYASRNSVDPALYQLSQRGSQHFLDLPAELRIMIYQIAVREEMKAVRTVGTAWGHENMGETMVVKTKQAYRYPSGLWQVSCEARQEAERSCIELPTRFVTSPGANVININQGHRRRRMISEYVGQRPYHKETTFFMDEPTAVEVFQLLHRNAIQPQTLGWLRNLMLDKRTFQHVLGEQHSFSHDRGGGPFVYLPGLKRIVVGFLYRFQDVAMLEGRYDDVVTEVQVVEDPEADDEAFRWIVRSPHALHPMLELIILTTARQTRAEVNAIEEAGINVVWGVIESGVTRRPDIYEWFAGN